VHASEEKKRREKRKKKIGSRANAEKEKDGGKEECRRKEK